MPTGAIEDENGMGTGCAAATDLGQVQAHQLGVDGRQHEGCSRASCRADGAEQVNPMMALIARRRWSRAAARPQPGQRPLLTDPGFILKPDFQRLTPSGNRKPFARPLGEVFLNASWASASFLG